MTNHAIAVGPLHGVRVVDLTTGLGAYTGRLLSDLGAEVIRVEPEGGVQERRQPPHGDSGLSLAFAFTEAGKRSVLDDDIDLEGLLGTAQILLTSDGPATLRARGLHPDDVTGRHPGLVHVSISPYGLTGPYADRPASDLTLLAAGGLLALAGDPDREPVRAWGNQTTIIGGVHGAAAALIALHSLETTGRGQVVDLSVQEAVAHSLENAAQYLDLEGIVRSRVGAGPVESGTGLFRCADGWIYLVGGLGGRPLAWSAIVDWLLDNGVTEADALRGEEWQERSWRRSTEGSAAFRKIFEGFARTRTKVGLYEAGQSRGISIAPVSTPADLLESPQLAARHFFRTIDVDGQDLRFPGSPYRFTGATVAPRCGPPALGEMSEPKSEGNNP
ncbi:CoA transferase [Saccharopolyspora shandongensis]|uniref:CaiB/BaiF CoA transferase family protein n=1 Tax=Saccharopolyspora shandongensis TaxID=418495 RepID=UPI0033E2A3F0